MDATRVVLVTGAGGDLGRALTRAFGGGGYRVAGIDLPAALDQFRAAADETDHLPVPCDLRDWEQIRSAVDHVARTFGRLDVVVNNAVARTDPTMKPLEDCGEDEFDNVLAVGPRAALGVMRAALPHLRESRGRIINVGSGAGVRPKDGLGAYGVAKAGLHSLTRSAALEWGRYGITVNGILPLVMTEQLHSVLEKNPGFALEVPPIGRVGDPEHDVGAAALFLASEAASYLSGQNIFVDGANSLR